MSKIFTHPITFGDCDPAGIVFYPNILAWMDKAFHQVLLPHGGHAHVCGRLSCLGFGLVSVSADFLRPLKDTDAVDIHISDMAWSEKTVTVAYQGKIGEAVHFKGKEVRCMFMKTPDGISTAPIAPLRDILG